MAVLRKVSDPPEENTGLPMLFMTPVPDMSGVAVPIKADSLKQRAILDFIEYVRTEMRLWPSIKRWFKNVF